LAGLQACEGTLGRYGGHRAAAGLEIERARLEDFRERFWEYTAGVLDPSSAICTEAVDAVVGGEALGHEVAAGLERLGPFGKGNPEIRLLVPGARIGDVRAMGEGERHARFSLASGPARASGVAFGVGTSLAGVAENGPLDVSLRLELDEWNGAVSPRIVLGSLYPSPAGEPSDLRCPDDEYRARLAAALEREPALVEASVAFTHPRARLDRTQASGIASVASLASSGEPVLVVCADAIWRRGLVESAASPARFGGGRAAVLAARGPLASGLVTARRLLEAGGGIALADWQALALHPELAAEFPHVVLADPAPEPRVEAVAMAAARRAPGYAHILSSHEDPSLSLRALEHSFPSRAALGPVYRALRDRATRPLSLDAVRSAIEAGAGEVRSPEWCGRAIRALAEIGVVRMAGSRDAPMLEVVSSVRGELERSPSFAANQKTHEECVRFLTRGKEQSSTPMPAAA
jgi:single-stranded-DNA-specific exonuclease